MTIPRNRPLALIGGGSGAIGGSVCRRLAADGFDIALTYRSNKATAGDGGYSL